MAGLSTMIVLALTIALYGKGFAAAMGSYVFGTQILFFAVATAGTYVLSFSFPQTQRSVLTLGMSTRNVGAAFAPLLSIQEIDQRATVMVAIGLPMQIIASLLTAQWFARRAPKPAP
jgi:bile acid:Na+ symporter, BASS family